MSNPIKRVPIVLGGTVPTGAAALLPADAVDLAVAALTDVTLYARAKNISNPAVAFGDRVGVTHTPDGALTKSSSDSHFNNKPTINLDPDTANPCFNTSAIATANFTFICPIRMANKTTSYILGSYTAGGSPAGIDIAINLGNKLVVTPQHGGTSYTSTAVGIADDTTTLFWCSLSGTTFRWGNAGTAITESATLAAAHIPGGSTSWRPFSASVNGTDSVPDGQTNGWLILPNAYAATGTGEDARIANVITAWKTLLGL
jgi:hypothetical protein